MNISDTVTANALTSDDIAYIERMGAQHPDVLAQFEWFLALAPVERPVAALKRLGATPRTGWVRRNVPSPESVAEHMESAAALARRIPAPLRVKRELAADMLAIHDMPEAIASDFTPHDPISRDDKHRLEWLAAKVIFAAPNYARELGMIKEMMDEKTPTAQWVHDLDKLDAVARAGIYETEHGLSGLFDEFATYAATRVKTLAAKELLAEWQERTHALVPLKITGSAMAGIAATLPASDYALKQLQQASEVGFKWPKAKHVLGKIDEERLEVHEAIAQNDVPKIASELGDVMHALHTLAVFFEIDARQAVANSEFRETSQPEEFHPHQALAEMDYTLQKLTEAVQQEGPSPAYMKARIATALGNAMRATHQLANSYDIEPEAALDSTNRKFTERFTFTEKRVWEKGGTMPTTPLNEMIAIWNEAKPTPPSR